MAKSKKEDISKEVLEITLSEVNKSIDKYLLSLDAKILHGKALEYTKLWMTLDPSWHYADRYESMALAFKVSAVSVKGWCKKLNWRILDDLAKHRNKLLDQLGAKKVTPSEAKFITDEQLETAAEEATKQAENPAFSQLAANLRETTVLSLSLLKDSLIYAYKMSVFYTRQIELVIEAAGGMERLTKDNAIEIQEYEKKVNKYLESVKYAINPNSIFNNLKMLGYSSDLLKANEDTRVMTPDYIQKMLLEMVQGEGMRNYTQKPFEAMIEETDYAGVELPSIDGRANKNTESDARNKK